MMFASRMTQRRLYPNLAPPEMLVAKLPGSIYATHAMNAGPKKGSSARMPRVRPSIDARAAICVPELTVDTSALLPVYRFIFAPTVRRGTLLYKGRQCRLPVGAKHSRSNNGGHETGKSSGPFGSSTDNARLFVLEGSKRSEW